MTADHVLRAVLTADVFLAASLFGRFVGDLWHEPPASDWPVWRRWPLRVVLVGVAIVLLYVLAGQAKAFNLAIPFDGFSVIGLVGFTVLNVGLGWVLKERQRHGEG